MVEKILGKEHTNDIFFASMLTGLMTEKKANEIIPEMEKDAFSVAKFLAGLNTAGRLTAAGASGLFRAAAAVPSGIVNLVAAGAGTGALAGGVYNTLKDSLQHEDPKTKMNRKIEAMFKNRKRELEDAKWMDRVRAMRDELKRSYKKMTPEEYRQKYDALVAALDERGE